MVFKSIIGATCTCLLLMVFAAPVHANLLTFTEVGSIDKPLGEGYGRGITFLGSRMFYSGFPDDIFGDSNIYELDPATGEILNTINPGIGPIIGLAANPDDGLLYVAGCCGSTIQKVDASTGSVVGSLTVEAESLQGLSISGGKLYTGDNSFYTIDEVDIITGATLRSLYVGDMQTDFGILLLGNIQSIEVFNDTIFLGVDDTTLGRSLELYEFSLNDFSYIGIGHYGQRAGGSGYDGEFLWLDIEGETTNALIKLAVNPVPIPAAVWLFGSGLIGLIGVARRKA